MPRLAVAVAPLQQRRQQRPPWPSPARSSPASCKVRGYGGLRDAASGSIPDPVRFSSRYTPAPVPPAPLHPAPRHPPPPCTLARGIAVPGASSAAHRASPCQDLPVPEPFVPIFGDRCSPLVLPGTLSDPGPPLGEASRLPSGEFRLPHRAGPWELPPVLTASWLNTLPSPAAPRN